MLKKMFSICKALGAEGGTSLARVSVHKVLLYAVIKLPLHSDAAASHIS